MLQLSDIQHAAKLLESVAVNTPLLKDQTASRELETSIYVKAECLQRSGSFKIRGAYTKVNSLSAEEKRKGIIAASAGNHAQGVALAGQMNNIPTTIVMPEYAPLTKVNATKSLGAEVVLYGQSFDDAAAKADELQGEKGYTLVHAFDDEKTMAGQGTIGLEILRDLPDVTHIVVPIGGGGLIAGIATAVKALKPSVKIIGVQAEGCSSIKPSLQAGEPVMARAARTIADGIAVKRPGTLTLPIIQQLVDDVLDVSEDDIARGIAHCVQNSRLVVEGAGAAGIAALLAEYLEPRPENVVCTVLCGGNIDGNLLARVIEQVMVRQGRYVLLKLSVIDRPGALARLITMIANQGANVIDVFHRRALWLAPLGKVGVELILEVRDSGHSQQVIDHLIKVGY
ncbi:MAG: threonine ammonia-lyase, partial [Trueperaceae bacterium]